MISPIETAVRARWPAVIGMLLSSAPFATAGEGRDCSSVKASLLTFPFQTLGLAYVAGPGCQLRLRVWDASAPADQTPPRIVSTPPRDRGRAFVDGRDIIVRALPARKEPILIEIAFGDDGTRNATVIVGEID